MRRASLVPTVSVALAGVLTAASASLAGATQPVMAKVPKSIAVEDPPVFPLADVKRGQRGRGYTVFSSARGPEPFEFEVLGVMRSYLGPGEDLIIARLIGEQIERTGVISGMSGSPVYIDGKLVGAVGYRFGSFTKDAIAGITPIERMLASRTGESRAQRRAPASGSPWGKAEPIAVPIAASGLNPAVAAAFEPELKKRGYGPLVPMGSTGGGALAQAGQPGNGRLFASGPVAGVLVDGDVFLAGIGTVTWVKGDEFLAFGHPFLGTGASEMPISDAYILTTVASEAGSWKMGQATVPVGRLTDDRLHAIGGVMGDRPRTLPIDVQLDLPGPRSSADARKELHFNVFRHPTDTPLFAAIALANSLSSRIGVELDGTLEVTGSVRLRGGLEAPFRTVAVADGSPVDVAAAMALLGELGELQFNGFREVEIEAVQMKVTRRPEVDSLKITRVTPLGRAVPGGEVQVEVEVQPYEQPRRTFVETLRIPRGLPPGSYKLVAASPASAHRLERASGLLAEPTNFASFLRSKAQQPRDGALSLYFTGEHEGWSIDGALVPGLPASMAGLLEDSGRERKRDTRAIRVLRRQLECALFGDASTRVIVDEPPR